MLSTVPHVLPLSPVLSQGLILEPASAAVLRGSTVSFRATVAVQWEVMTWEVNNTLVLTVTSSSTNVTSSGQFSAAFCSQDASCVEFTVWNVSREQAGLLVCRVQDVFGSRTANLSVQGQ